MRILGLLAAGLLTMTALPTLAQQPPAATQPRSPELTEAVRLNQQVVQLYNQGKYPTAMPLAQQALVILEKALGPDHPAVAISLNDLALLYQAQGNYVAAEPLHKRALTIREKALGPDYPDVATSLNNLAALYCAQDKYGAAEPLYKRSLAIWEKALGPDHPDVATSLNNLAALYHAQSNHAAAEPLLKRAIAIREKALGPNHLDVAASLNNLAELYRAQDNYGTAEPLHKRALAIWEKALGPDHPDVATSLNNLALLYAAQGNYGAAEPVYKRALAIREKALSPDHPDVATSLNNLANLYQYQGNYGAAEPLYKRALSISEKALGPNHSDVALRLNALALLYTAQGNYGAAEPLHKRALAIWGKALGPDHPYVATSLNNLAELYHAQGNDSVAEPLYKRALSISEKALGPNHLDVAFKLNNLAALYTDQGNYGAAEPLHKRALAIWGKALSSDHPNVATSLDNLAELYRAQGNYVAADPLFKRALAIREKALGPDHPDVATSLNNLALLYAQGNYGAAEPLYKRALAIREKALGPDHPDVATSLNNLATMRWAVGQVGTALDLRQRGLEIEERNLSQNLAFGSEAQKRAYANTFIGSTDGAISLHLQGVPNNLTAARLALTTILRRKGRVLEVLTDTFQRLRNDLSPDNQKDLDTLADYRRQYSNLANAIDSKLSPEQRRTQMTALDQKADQLQAELSRRSAPFRTETTPVEIAAVQAQIPTNAALIEFYRYKPFNPQAKKQSDTWGKPRYAAYWLLRSGAPQWRDLGAAAPIDQAIAQFQQALIEVGSDQATKQAGRQLDALILEPIRQTLGNTRHLLIAPDSQLNLIPFAALVDAQNRYLVETYDISYLTSGRDLLRLQNPSPSQQAPVIFAQIDHTKPGNPDSVTLAQQGQIRPPNQLAQAKTRSASPSSASFNLKFDNLDHTGAEAQDILPTLPSALLLTNTNATENALKALNSPRILHLATHGFFLPNQPNTNPDQPLPPGWENPLLRSGLVFAGSNLRQSGNDDGVLTALEASELKLKGTQLVVMSACKAGNGDVANGEGVYGLRRALVLAGVAAQVMTFWSVYDEPTRYFMAEYYKRLQAGGDRSATLRQIQLEFLHDPNLTGYAHPVYWAAFTLTGDWRQLRE